MRANRNETYMAALGMLVGTPLGDAALRRDVRQIDLAERTDLKKDDGLDIPDYLKRPA